VTDSSSHSAPTERGLVRALDTRALAATAFNVTVGGGIFVLPAVVAASIGPSAPLAYVVCAIAMGLIVLCFAQAGSRVTLTGGPYAYVEIAFGPFVGFLAGVLLWVMAIFSTAAVSSAFAASLATLWSPLGGVLGRALILAAEYALLAWLNVRGTKQGARLVEVVTVAKLLPIILFLVVGFALARGPAPNVFGNVSAPALGRSVIVLIFAFAGIESALVPSGEVKDPARTVPRALGIAMVAVTLLYVAIQYVAQKILGASLATEQAAPIVSAARVVAGTAGATFIAIGASISMFGHGSGMTLATPRILYAFGRDGVLPRVFSRLNPRFHTPDIAIVVQCAIMFVVALTGTFASLAILADVSVLTLYALCALAAWQLARRNVHEGGTPFRVPGGAVVPWLAIIMIVWILTHAKPRELEVVAGTLAVAAVLYLLRRGEIEARRVARLG
jgi:amino acid transporter